MAFLSRHAGTAAVSSNGALSAGMIVFFCENASLLRSNALTHPHFAGVVILLRLLEVVEADVDASSCMPVLGLTDIVFCGKNDGVPVE
jgi:hypothetical protein